MLPSEIGSTIKRRRRELGWSQYDLASKAYVTQQAVSWIERGDFNTIGHRNIYTIGVLCKALGLDDLGVNHGPNYAQAIKDKRKALDLTQAQLAKVLGISNSRVAQLEHNTRNMSEGLRERVLDWLDGETDMSPVTLTKDE